MPFLDRDKFEASVEVAPGATFVTGGSITGVVNLRAKETCTVRCVSLRYSVLERVELANQAAAAPVLGQDAREREVVIFDLLLFGARTGQTVRVEAGDYCYPFQLQVPRTAPASLAPTSLGWRSFGCLCCPACTACACSGCAASPIYLRGEVRHQLRATVVIPNSLFDKNDTVVPVTVRSACPADAAFGQVARVIDHCDAPRCSLLQFCCPGPRTDFTLTAINPLVVLSEAPVVRFAVSGLLDSSFSVALVRRVLGLRETHMVAEQCVASLSFARAALGGGSSSVQASLDLRELAATLPASMDTPSMRVLYELTVVLPDGGCCAPDFRAPRIRLELYHTLAAMPAVHDAPPAPRAAVPAVPAATAPPPFVAPHDGLMTATLATMPLGYADPTVGHMVSYVRPPPGTAALFRPAVPVVADAPDEIVWGVVVDAEPREPIPAVPLATTGPATTLYMSMA